MRVKDKLRKQKVRVREYEIREEKEKEQFQIREKMRVSNLRHDKKILRFKDEKYGTIIRLINSIKN